MAWRPHRYLICGELDNTRREKVTGWMYFQGLPKRVTLDLEGDFHRDICGASILFLGYATPETDPRNAAEYMKSFSLRQTGKVGDMTAGLPPYDYGHTPYFEWYSNENGRVVLELPSERVRMIGTPVPYVESDPISGEQQDKNMADFLRRVQDELDDLPNDRSDGNGSPGPR